MSSCSIRNRSLPDCLSVGRFSEAFRALLALILGQHTKVAETRVVAYLTFDMFVGRRAGAVATDQTDGLPFAQTTPKRADAVSKPRGLAQRRATS